MEQPTTVRRLVGGGHSQRLRALLAVGLMLAFGAFANASTSRDPFVGFEGMLTFALGGGAVVCLASAFRLSLAMTGPQLVLQLSPSEIVRGEPFRLEWSFEGSATTVRNRVKSLEVTIASKRITERSGEEGDTYEKPLSRRRVLFVQGEELPAGAVEFTLPSGSPRTGRSRGGNVRWELLARIRRMKGASSTDRHHVTVVSAS